MKACDRAFGGSRDSSREREFRIFRNRTVTGDHEEGTRASKFKQARRCRGRPSEIALDTRRENQSSCVSNRKIGKYRCCTRCRWVYTFLGLVPDTYRVQCTWMSHTVTARARSHVYSRGYGRAYACFHAYELKHVFNTRACVHTYARDYVRVRSRSLSDTDAIFLPRPVG